ncbi:tetratricopeptide repeat protein [Desulfosarcina variabilis str. Montpellier]|uniref:tetratricopeptide repeat protein n=1 Tax=Desulfosarcina variabilis TaxID=2300 RepID=UPI003AFAEF99
MDRSVVYQESNVIWHNICELDDSGNINTLIATAVNNWETLAGFKDWILRRILFYLNRCPQHISAASRTKLRSLDQNVIEPSLLRPLKKSSQQNAFSPIGRIWFPVVANNGMMRELVVVNGGKAHMPKQRLWQLDRVGAAVCAVVEKRSGLPQWWDPRNYHFMILDHLGTEDLQVKGTSMDLPLAIALYSFLTKEPIPSNISATGHVDRYGQLGSVEGISEKVKAIIKERSTISRLWVAHSQKDIISQKTIESYPCKSLFDVITKVFKSTPDLSNLAGPVIVDEQLKLIQSQYSGKMINSCMENAIRLITHLETDVLMPPQELSIPALFEAYWRKGCCHCHLGEVRETFQELTNAEKIYRRYKRKGLVRELKYLEMQNSYAVALKDTFQYKEAERIHKKVEKAFERCIDSLPHHRAKNLSSLSQLYDAMGRYKEASALQRRVLKMIRTEDRHRNYGYLGMIYSRWGKFPQARKAFVKASQCLKKYGKSIDYKFYWLYQVELAFRQAISRKRRKIKAFNDLYAIVKAHFPIVECWQSSLAQKYFGLAKLQYDNPEEGMACLERAVAYFETCEPFMYRLLESSIRAPMSIWMLENEWKVMLRENVSSIVKCLEIQPNVAIYFKSERRILTRWLGMRKQNAKSKEELKTSLLNICRKIPY